MFEWPGFQMTAVVRPAFRVSLLYCGSVAFRTEKGAESARIKCRYQIVSWQRSSAEMQNINTCSRSLNARIDRLG